PADARQSGQGTARHGSGAIALAPLSPRGVAVTRRHLPAALQRSGRIGHLPSGAHALQRPAYRGGHRRRHGVADLLELLGSAASPGVIGRKSLEDCGLPHLDIPPVPAYPLIRARDESDIVLGFAEVDRRRGLVYPSTARVLLIADTQQPDALR